MDGGARTEVPARGEVTLFGGGFRAFRAFRTVRSHGRGFLARIGVLHQL